MPKLYRLEECDKERKRPLSRPRVKPLLTPLQAIHYESVKWLLNDGCRGVGKTYLLAYAYLMNALEHPGTYFSPVDFPRHSFIDKRRMLETIKAIATELEIGIIIKASTMEFAARHPNSYLSLETRKQLEQL